MIDLRSSESNPQGHEVTTMRRYSEYIGRRRRTHRQGRGSRAIAVLSGILLVGTVACESLLEVEIPGQVEDAALDDPALAGTMVISALGEFECALNTLVPTNGFLTGEFIASNFFLSSNVWGWRGETEIRATSGAYGHTVGKSLALGYVARAHAVRGRRLAIEILGERRPARIVPNSPLDPSNDRLRA